MAVSQHLMYRGHELFALRKDFACATCRFRIKYELLVCESYLLPVARWKIYIHTLRYSKLVMPFSNVSSLRCNQC